MNFDIIPKALFGQPANVALPTDRIELKVTINYDRQDISGQQAAIADGVRAALMRSFRSPDGLVSTSLVIETPVVVVTKSVELYKAS